MSLTLKASNSNTVHEGVRAYLAVYEDMVRDGEPERDKRDGAAKSGASYAASEWPKK